MTKAAADITSLTRKDVLTGVRWVLVPFAAAFGFVLAMALSIPLDNRIAAWLWSPGFNRGSRETFLVYTLGYNGALAACLVLLCGTLMAPANRRRVAEILLVVGAVVALVIGGPQNFHVPFLRWWPIVGTYLGGLGTYAILRRRVAPPAS
jgi:hypothetical protein